MEHLARVILLVVIGVFLVVALAVQILLLPHLAAESATSWPEIAYLEAPVLVTAIAIVACAEVVLVILARLVLLTDSDRIFTRASLRWVDAMTGCFVLAAILAGGLGIGLRANDALNPGIGVMLCAGIAGCAAVALLLIVMRGLLVRATTMRDDLAEVV
ncbi:DUF2975 domain-containing protein [Galbitalea sp. SE-J8]|uniref:DUF2975 domain-containing protein n=1 Tax=Galbitalea sp. SE-J8 TaxID=3054952 RepID=UPI00259C8C6C|nr:DUF2975 domain-containing protein [Galbitalea sp. SE-J8]MDM4763571.1 DUF2975 domain-containing protein [Galbitalea sp. SE-J8]